ncbi:hypothetical protein DPEC_G00185660 [Dallia pectoralis]|uniref:Uncharacterized protein n=1 Tax=Dallia pectoralis TaxID=75939 RepID=A0ACC2GBB9_DALPE|nr:hypothetical protein DPEC_G00185660 [Dallia pectoralis]
MLLRWTGSLERGYRGATSSNRVQSSSCPRPSRASPWAEASDRPPWQVTLNGAPVGESDPRGSGGVSAEFTQLSQLNPELMMEAPSLHSLRV